MELLLKPLLRLFAWMVSRGGAPRAEGGGRETVFPLRPGVLWFAVGCLGYAGWALAVEAPRALHGSRERGVWFLLGIGVFVGFVAVMLLTQRLWLDEDGLRMRRGIGAGKLIRWEAFSHFERYHSKEAGKATYYFRSGPQGLTGEETTITVPEMSYNTDQLLAAIAQRVWLEERTRVKRHWWGG